MLTSNMNARGQIISYKWREYLLFLVNAAKEKLEMLLDTKWNIRTVSSQYLSEGGKRQKVSFRTPMAVHRNRKVLREDSTEKLNMILNSDIPRDLRLFILLDLKIVRILSKSQKELSSRTFTAAWTTILKWRKLADRVSIAVGSQKNWISIKHC